MSDIRTRIIHLSDCYDTDLLNKSIGENKYTVFDKHKLLAEFGVTSFLEIENSPSRLHLFNIEAKAAVIKAIKNKKHKNIVYFLYKSDPNEIKDLLLKEIQPELEKSYKLEFVLLSDRHYKNWTDQQIDFSDFEDQSE